jgi:hypothetical protein
MHLLTKVSGKTEVESHFEFATRDRIHETSVALHRAHKAIQELILPRIRRRVSSCGIHAMDAIHS